MGCSNVKMSHARSLAALNLTQAECTSLNKVNQQFRGNVPRTDKTDVPVVAPEIRTKLQLSWIDYQSRFTAGHGISPFTYILFKHRDIFKVHFAQLDMPRKESTDIPPSPTTMPSPFECKRFLRHMAQVRSVLNYCFGIVLRNEDWDQTRNYLKRLGAKHAEIKVSSEELNTFILSFLWALEQNQRDASKPVKEFWGTFITYVVANINQGLTEHYDKVRSVLNPDEGNGHNYCCVKLSCPTIQCSSSDKASINEFMRHL